MSPIPYRAPAANPSPARVPTNRYDEWTRSSSTNQEEVFMTVAPRRRCGLLSPEGIGDALGTQGVEKDFVVAPPQLRFKRREALV
jgi:hypothetical protein